MKFKDNLRKQRTLAGLSQESLADRMSVSRQTISKWENGDSHPSTKHIFMLSEILECDIEALINPTNSHRRLISNAITENLEPTALHTDSDNSKPTATTKPQSKRIIYWIAGALTALIIALLGFSLTRPTSPLDNSKLAVFDRIIDGSLTSAINSFTSDDYTEAKVIGYGITEPDKTFFVKCSLNSDNRDQPCSAIIYFCEENGGYSYECQLLDDPDFVPKGDYYEVG